jgi:hypothetical protein
MFPSRFSRLADSVLELADAMLAPDSTPLADHPHRKPLRAPGSSARGRGPFDRRRRPGAIAAPPQPCVTPLARGTMSEPQARGATPTR